MGDFCYPFASCHSCMFWGFGKANHHVLLPHTGLRGLLEPQRPETKTHEENNICNSGLQAQQIWWNYWYQYIIIQPTRKANETSNPTKTTPSPTHLFCHSKSLPFFLSSWGHAPSWQSCLVHGWRRSLARSAGNKETPLNGEFLQGHPLDQSYIVQLGSLWDDQKLLLQNGNPRLLTKHANIWNDYEMVIWVVVSNIFNVQPYLGK